MVKKTFFITQCTILLVISALFPLATLSAQDRGLTVVAAEAVGRDAAIGKQWAVFVAIDRYKEWGPLSNPVKDAKEIRDILKEQYFIDEVVELYDQNATAANIRRLFVDLRQKVKNNDSVFVFYAGHGHTDSYTNTGAWIPVDGGRDQFAQTNWLPNIQVRNMLSALPAKHVFLISDACFSGDILDTTKSASPEIDREYYRRAYSRVSRQVMTSGASESVPDASEFTLRLKSALRRAEGLCIDPEAIFTIVREVQTTQPMLGFITGTEHQSGGSFLFFRRPTEKPPTGSITVTSQIAGIVLIAGANTETRINAGGMVTFNNISVGNTEVAVRGNDGIVVKALPVMVRQGQTVGVLIEQPPPLPIRQATPVDKKPPPPNPFKKTVETTSTIASVPMPATSAAPVVQESVEWYQGKPIKNIVFDGLRSISVSKLDGVISPFIGAVFNDDVFWEIQGRLYALECFESITPSAVPTDAAGNAVIIKFKVTERPIISRITFVGNSHLSRNKLMNVITLKVNDMPNQTNLRMDEQAVVNEYLEKSYPDVSVRTEFDTGVVTFYINEGAKSIIEELRFEGNSLFSNRNLRKQLSLKEKNLVHSGVFQEAKLIAARASIEQYYHDRGYIDAEVTDVFRETTRDQKGNNNLTITFRIYEGRLYTFGGFTITGNENISDQQVYAQVRSKTGEVVNARRVEEDLQRIMDLYTKNGYNQANIETFETRDTADGVLSFIGVITE